MRDLSKGGTKEEMLHNLWVSRLPANIKPMLIMSDTLTLNALAEMADRMIETQNMTGAVMSTSFQNADINRVDTRSNIHQTGDCNQRFDQLHLLLKTTLSEMSHMKSELQDIKQQLSMQQPNCHSRSCSCLRSNQRSNSQTRTPQMCFYYKKYGAAAKRCILSCTFKSENQEN